MTRFTPEEIQAVYRAHPLRKETILQRVERQPPAGRPLTEADLAEDPLTAITDQNHLGGLTFTHDLALRADVSSRSRVLDIGCGLGGAARALAWTYGCRVHGIDLSPDRIAGARDLTELVGLSHLVSFQCGDALAMELPAERYDVLWGQGSWSHFEHKRDFLDTWRRVLTADGRVALEDVCLLREPGAGRDADLVRALEHHWKCDLVPLHGDRGWVTAFEAVGMSPSLVEDHSAELLGHVVALQEGASRSPDPVSAFEQAAWRLAIDAARRGLIGYFRLVGETRM